MDVDATRSFLVCLFFLAGSYEDLLRQFGITKICTVIGKIGSVEKDEIFENLNERLTDCQAFI